MTQTIVGLMLAAGLSFAQSQTTGKTVSAGSQPQSKTTATTQPGQKMTGVLMDASCSVIASSRGASEGTRSRSGLTTYTGSGSTSTATESGATSGAQSATAHGTTGSAPTSSATTGGGPAGPVPSTAGANQGTGATSGANSASALGTTGAATTSGPSTAVSEEERSRMITTVREKYRDCMARPTTTSFAIHANGQLYVLDPASNEMVRQQMQNEAFRASMANPAGSPQWITVSVTGTPSGDTLSVSSVRR